MHQTHTAVDTATQTELELGNQLEVVEIENTTQDSVDFSLIEILPSGRVSARNLYKFLELRHSDIARWLTSKIKENDFAIENEDYWGFSTFAEGNQIQDFELTPNFAKKLAMMSKSANSEKVRDYFLAMEQKAKSNISSKDALLLKLYSSDPLEVATAHKALVELETKPLLNKIEQDKPLVDFAQDIAISQNTIQLGQFAGLLPEKWNLGQKNLFKLLREKEILLSSSKENWNKPPQKYLKTGYFEMEEGSYINAKTNRPTTYITTKITGKGQIWLNILEV